MKVNEDNYDILRKAEKITGVDSDIRWFDAENIDGYIDEENLLSIIKDLIVEYHRKEEQLDDLEQDLRDNYEPRRYDPYEEFGVSPRDFC